MQTLSFVNTCFYFIFYFISSPNVSPSDHLTITNHTGDSVILSIFHEMVAAGEQQEAFLLRELETDITVARCVEIMFYLEQNIALVTLFLVTVNE